MSFLQCQTACSALQNAWFCGAKQAVCQCKNAGAGAEIAAMVAEEAIEYLDAPIVRIGAPFCPVPFSPTLEQAYMPSVEKIVQAVREQR